MLFWYQDIGFGKINEYMREKRMTLVYLPGSYSSLRPTLLKKSAKALNESAFEQSKVLVHN
jgi:hypothetical protein